MNTYNMSVVEVRCDAIRVGERHRREMGDLEALAASIAAEGLPQPIGITEENLLAFGARRLAAFRDILTWPTIPARMVRVSSVVAGEFAENEIRKNFTPSERVVIGLAIDAYLGERRSRDSPEVLPKFEDRIVPFCRRFVRAALAPSDYTSNGGRR